MSNILQQLGNSLHFSKFQAVVPQSLLIGLHCPCDGSGAGNAVHSQLIQLPVPAADQLQIIVEQVRTEQAQSLQLRALHLLALHLHGAGAADGTGEAAGIGDVLLLGQGLAADLFKILEAAGREVPGGQLTPKLHGADQTGGTHPGQLGAGEGVGLQSRCPLFMVFHGPLPVMELDLMIAGGHNSLQVLAAKDGAGAAPARRPFPTGNGSVEHPVLPCRANAHHAIAALGAVEGCQFFSQALLCVPGFQAPESARVVVEHLPIVDLDPHRLRAFSADDQCVDTGLFQVKAEVPAAIGGGGNAGQWGKGGDIKAVGGRGEGAGHRPGGNDDDVFRAEGVLPAGKIVIHDFRGHGLAADVQLPVPVRPGIVPLLAAAQVDFQHTAHISCVICHDLAPFGQDSCVKV